MQQAMLNDFSLLIIHTHKILKITKVFVYVKPFHSTRTNLPRPTENSSKWFHKMLEFKKGDSVGVTAVML